MALISRRRGLHEHLLPYQPRSHAATLSVSTHITHTIPTGRFTYTGSA